MAVIELRSGQDVIARVGEQRFRAAGADAELTFGLMRRHAVDPELFGDVILLLETDAAGDPRALVTMAGPYPALIVGFGDPAHIGYGQIVDAFAATGRRPSGVNGAARCSEPFADAWRMAGAQVEWYRDSLAYELRTVAEIPDPGGFCRPAVGADEDLLTDWMVAFAAAIDEPWDDEQARSTVQRITATGDFVVWEREGEVVSTAGINRRTPWSSTVALVYTPRQLRGHGYARAVVAALSRRELAAGAEWVSLFADAANPTTNHIYAEIGYRPAATFRQLRLNWDNVT